MKQAKWNVTPPYTKERALKAVLTGVEHPRLLHVATHGVFSPDQDKKTSGFDAELPSGLEDPMLRSGLMFADGADRAFKREPTGDVEQSKRRTIGRGQPGQYDADDQDHYPDAIRSQDEIDAIGHTGRIVQGCCSARKSRVRE